MHVIGRIEHIPLPCHWKNETFTTTMSLKQLEMHHYRRRVIEKIEHTPLPCHWENKHIPGLNILLPCQIASENEWNNWVYITTMSVKVLSIFHYHIGKRIEHIWLPYRWQNWAYITTMSVKVLHIFHYHIGKRIEHISLPYRWQNWAYITTMSVKVLHICNVNVMWRLLP